jgi:hypothetical protein
LPEDGQAGMKHVAVDVNVILNQREIVNTFSCIKDGGE